MSKKINASIALERLNSMFDAVFQQLEVLKSEIISEIDSIYFNAIMKGRLLQVEEILKKLKGVKTIEDVRALKEYLEESKKLFENK